MARWTWPVAGALPAAGLVAAWPSRSTWPVDLSTYGWFDVAVAGLFGAGVAVVAAVVVNCDDRVRAAVFGLAAALLAAVALEVGLNSHVCGPGLVDAAPCPRELSAGERAVAAVAVGVTYVTAWMAARRRGAGASPDPRRSSDRDRHMDVGDERLR